MSSDFNKETKDGDLQKAVPYLSELYSAYAAGRLDPAYALLVETQAALRPDIRRDMRQAELVSGIFLESEERDMLAPNAFEKALQAIDRLEEPADPARAAHKASERLDELMALPEPLREKALESCMHTGWRRLTNSVSRLKINDGRSGHAHLYRISPGARMPRHTHHGDELTLVVAGGFTDESGAYGPGDVSLQTPHDTHQPVADDHGVCMVFAVSDGGMKFKGVLGLVQKLFA